MKRHIGFAVIISAGVLLVAGCGDHSPQPAPDPEVAVVRSEPDEWPHAPGEDLAAGREIWIENCRNCHGIGKAGSPRFGDTSAWEPRIGKGFDVLVASAVNGFEGKTEAGMPARGGNKDLTDEQVRTAVLYMIHFSRQ
jgi:cytochrome c5